MDVLWGAHKWDGCGCETLGHSAHFEIHLSRSSAPQFLPNIPPRDGEVTAKEVIMLLDFAWNRKAEHLLFIAMYFAM